MDALKKKLEKLEKPELISIITQMLRQEPDLEWLVNTPLPTASSRKASIDPKIYQQQILAAMSAGDYQQKRKRGEVQRRLAAIQSIADEFAANENYADSGMDLDEDIPGLLVSNTTPEERDVIGDWVRDALSQTKAEGSAGYSRQRYEAFLATLEQVARS
ncbi:MAG TPA: hypothetical protein VIX20_17790 [Ktedonobacteraceae bacterium]